MNRGYLEEVIKNFIAKERQSRFHDLLASKQRYNDFLYNLLRDSRYFDPKCIIKTENNEQSPNGVYKILKKYGAKDKCYIISLDSELDGLILNIESALLKIVCTMSESLVYCLEGQVAYFEGHEGFRYILKSKL